MDTSGVELVKKPSATRTCCTRVAREKAIRVLLVLWGAAVDIPLCLSILFLSPCPTQELGQSDCATLERYSAAWMVGCLIYLRIAAGVCYNSPGSWIGGFVSCFLELGWQWHVNVVVGNGYVAASIPTVVILLFIVLMLAVWPDSAKPWKRMGSVWTLCRRRQK